MNLFERLIWKEDRVLLNNIVFRLQHYKSDDWDGGNNHIIFYKIKKLIDQYDLFFRSCGWDLKMQNVIEIGMWGGGSLVFWNEILNPQRLLGIDIIKSSDNEVFDQYISRINLTGKKIIPCWGTDQADKPTIQKLIQTYFGKEPINMVFDDCSHMYGPTLASFNAIFPYMAIGGLYIIEDWAWKHWITLDTGMPVQSALTNLIIDIIKATGNEGLIESVTIYEGFAVVKRGKLLIEHQDRFNLHSYILEKV